jgi:hypothetical protein
MFYNVAADHHRANQDLGAAMQLCQSGLALAISIGSTRRQCLALQRAALIKRGSGDFSGAKEDASQSQRVAMIDGNLYNEAVAFWIEAICWRSLGNYGHTLSLLDRATHLMELCGMSSGGGLLDSIRHSRADIHQLKSQYMDARSIQTHILRDNTADQSTLSHAVALVKIVQIDIEIGATQYDVQQNINTAVRLFQKMNYLRGITYCDMFRAALDVQAGEFTIWDNEIQSAEAFQNSSAGSTR